MRTGCEWLQACRRSRAESSGILLDWHLPAEAIYIEGDELLLQRLLRILLDNAIRYTPESGEIRAEVYFLQPSSITKGFEAESNIYIGGGLSAYLNGSVGRANYTGNLNVTCAPIKCTGAPITVSAPSGPWLANTPSDVETIGATYQRKGWDVGMFNKRVDTFYMDNGQYHNQATINPFTVSNLFFNYTLRTNGRFDQTKFRLTFNNLFDQHSITGDTITGTALTQSISANGTTYIDPFTTSGPTPIAGGDNISVLPGHSIMLSVTFGLSPKR